MIIFYSTHCPRCRVLEMKLKQKNIQYQTNTNVDEMLDKGIKEAPMLEVNGQLLNFAAAVKWINGLEA